MNLKMKNRIVITNKESINLSCLIRLITDIEICLFKENISFMNKMKPTAPMNRIVYDVKRRKLKTVPVNMRNKSAVLKLVKVVSRSLSSHSSFLKVGIIRKTGYVRKTIENTIMLWNNVSKTCKG